MYDDRRMHINDARTPSVNSKYQKRQGANKVKQIEHATSDNMKLTPSGASVYSALSAMCNYLAQDRPHSAYAAKERCREFSVPTLQSLQKL